MRPKTKNLLKLIALMALILGPLVAQAAIVNCGGTVNHTNECQLTDLFLTIANVINLLLSIAWLISMLFILWGGWGMIGSAGNEEAVISAKATFSSAITGFFLVIAAFLLVNFMITLISGGNLSVGGSLRGAFGILKIFGL
jgi:hypothetical protein